jgi:dTMP kinase
VVNGPQESRRESPAVSRSRGAGDHPDRGRLIVLEGGEGSGKSTQAALLAERLGALLTREPGGTATGERLRAVLLDPELPELTARTETLLLLAARAQHVAEVIEPALAAGRDVVCDRFSGSTLAYQGYGRGLAVDDLAWMSEWAAGGLRPDRTLLLRVAPETVAERLGRRSGRDRIEREGAAFFDRVAGGFDSLAARDGEGWRVVDGTGTVAEVAARVFAAAQD